MVTDYFERTQGTGILATSDENGRVNNAIYARPHALEDGTLAFIMADRLSHHNLQSNPHACYLFLEDSAGFKGKRLYLTMLGESQDQESIARLRRRTYSPADEARVGPLHLVRFRVDEELGLFGAGPQ